ncbi:hypothetical protein [Desulfatiferula olefinivorans]
MHPVFIVTGLSIIATAVVGCSVSTPPPSVFNTPPDITRIIADRLLPHGSECPPPHTAAVYAYDIDHDRRLMLIAVADYLCTGSNSFLPVVLEDGSWRAGEFMDGAPSMVVMENDDSLWLVTQWQIEGTYPALFHSADGVSWREIPLPAGRDVDCCFERLTRLCVTDETIRITLEGDSDERREFWTGDRQGHDGLTLRWFKTPPPARVPGDCPDLPPKRGRWVPSPETSSDGMERHKGVEIHNSIRKHLD